MDLYEFIAAGEEKLAALESVGESVVALITHLVEGGRQHAGDEAAMRAFLDRIDADKERLAGAVTAGTPAAGDTISGDTAQSSPQGGGGDDSLAGGGADSATGEQSPASEQPPADDDPSHADQVDDDDGEDDPDLED